MNREEPSTIYDVAGLVAARMPRTAHQLHLVSRSTREAAASHQVDIGRAAAALVSAKQGAERAFCGARGSSSNSNSIPGLIARRKVLRMVSAQQQRNSTEPNLDASLLRSLSRLTDHNNGAASSALREVVMRVPGRDLDMVRWGAAGSAAGSTDVNGLCLFVRVLTKGKYIRSGSATPAEQQLLHQAIDQLYTAHKDSLFTHARSFLRRVWGPCVESAQQQLGLSVQQEVKRRGMVLDETDAARRQPVTRCAAGSLTLSADAEEEEELMYLVEGVRLWLDILRRPGGVQQAGLVGLDAPLSDDEKTAYTDLVLTYWSYLRGVERLLSTRRDYDSSVHRNLARDDMPVVTYVDGGITHGSQLTSRLHAVLQEHQRAAAPAAPMLSIGPIALRGVRAPAPVPVSAAAPDNLTSFFFSNNRTTPPVSPPAASMRHRSRADRARARSDAFFL